MVYYHTNKNGYGTISKKRKLFKRNYKGVLKNINGITYFECKEFYTIPEMVI